MDDDAILDINFTNFVSIGLIGATWLAGFALIKRIMRGRPSSAAASPNTNSGSGTVVPFQTGLNSGLGY